MEISHTLEQRVNALLETGTYQDAEEVLSSALSRLEADDFVLRNLPHLEVILEKAQEKPGRPIDRAGYEVLKEDILRKVLKNAGE